MKKAHIALLFAIGIAIMYIVSISGNYSSYANFDKAAANEGKVYQVVGELNKERGIYYEPTKDPNYFSFYMIDKDGKENKVVYPGPPPPDFERSEDVVLNGMMEESGEFIATKILLKCPSKYEDGKFEEKEYETKSYQAKT